MNWERQQCVYVNRARRNCVKHDCVPTIQLNGYVVCIYQDLLRKITFVIHILNVSRRRGLSQSQEMGGRVPLGEGQLN